MSFWEQLGYQGMGMLGGNWQAQNQYNRQRRLMGLRNRYQQELNQQGHDLQFDMWNKTNYGAQVKHMLEAGLNPALMYGNAGQGGTTGSQTGGSAGGGQAVGENIMDLQNMLVGDQSRNLKAQEDLARANAAKARAEAAKIGGVDTNLAKQQINESIAREKDLNASEILKAQQKLNLMSEQALTDVKTALETRKNEKGLTGSAIVDGFHVLGLDPIGNETDRNIARGLVGAWFGKEFVKIYTDYVKGLAKGKKNNTIKY